MDGMEHGSGVVPEGWLICCLDQANEIINKDFKEVIEAVDMGLEVLRGPGGWVGALDMLALFGDCVVLQGVGWEAGSEPQGLGNISGSFSGCTKDGWATCPAHLKC